MSGDIFTLREVLAKIHGQVNAGYALLDEIESEQAAEPWDRIIIDELAHNLGPYSSVYLMRDNGWWKRTLDQIDAVTIHHTLSDSVHATAAHYVKKDGGRPTIPYTVWITQTGEILLCVPLEQGLWHDHTGHRNTHLSVGLAGSLHLYEPAEVQLKAAVRVCVWAIRSDSLPGINGVDQITGHMDHIATACPGWASAKSGHWKARFYAMLEEALKT